eukprot:TRINITY_DN3179_c0_g1_i2.p1 TRINITY_DN3179_c0_g1~~TRINITY_DN3179_c0_g1_i2.p1  ORF type:complete len:392 (+),score=181.06 TRINITY_DN3179_c0_g1_i2:167-1342(+)
MTLFSNLQEEKKKNERLVNDLDQQKNEYSKLKKESESFAAQMKQREEILTKELKATMDQRSADNAESQEKFASNQTELNLLRQKLEAEHKVAEEREKTFSALQSEFESLRQLKREKEIEAESEKNERDKTISALRSQISELEEQKTILNQSLESKAFAEEAGKKTLEEEKEYSGQRDKEIERLHEENYQLKEIRGDLEKQIKEMSSSLNNLRLDSNDLRGELTQKAHIFFSEASLLEKIKELSSNLDDLSAKSSQQVKALADNLTAAEARARAFALERDKLKDTLAEQKKMYESVVNEFKSKPIPPPPPKLISLAEVTPAPAHSLSANQFLAGRANLKTTVSFDRPKMDSEKNSIANIIMSNLQRRFQNVGSENDDAEDLEDLDETDAEWS